MLNHGNLELVIFLIWYFACILFYCSVGNTPCLFDGRKNERTDLGHVKVVRQQNSFDCVDQLYVVCFSFSSNYVPKMNFFHKSSTITSVSINACQAFSPAGETTLEIKTTVVATQEMHLYFLLHFPFLCPRSWRKKTTPGMWANKVVTYIIFQGII